MPQNEKVLVVDFGGQYNQLVARRVRECNVYCEIVSYRVGLDAIRAQNPKGIIFTGGPNSVYVDGAPTIDPAIFDCLYNLPNHFGNGGNFNTTKRSVK